MMIEELFHPRRTPRFLTFPGYEREAGLWPAWASARRRRRAAWRGGWWRTGTPCTFGRLERVMQAPTFSGQKPFIDNLDPASFWLPSSPSQWLPERRIVWDRQGGVCVWSSFTLPGFDFGVNGYDVGDDQALRGPRSNWTVRLIWNPGFNQLGYWLLYYKD